MTDVLGNYDRWLHATANRIGTASEHDDLVQEGRVAMWRALATYDESRGSLPSWLTRAAEQRIKDVAWGHGQPFGHEAVRGVREVEVGSSLDELEENETEALLGYVEEAYQEGEIMQAIRSLSPRQQQYVFLRFWGGLDPRTRAPGIQALIDQFPIIREGWHWKSAKVKLAQKLAHLAA